jgi:hypothetical protein
MERYCFRRLKILLSHLSAMVLPYVCALRHSALTCHDYFHLILGSPALLETMRAIHL